jgi:glycosyltransferase involved in cell wall biosynthesis
VTTRIIHILHHSPSLIHDEPVEALLSRTGWHLELARFQREFLKDVEVECWTPERRLTRLVETKRAGVKSMFFPSYALGYAREICPAIFRRLEARADQIDCVFLHGSVSYFSALLLSRFGARLPFVVQNHGETSTLSRVARQGVGKPIDYALRVRLERRAFRKAHKLLCLNAANADDYRRNGVPDDKLVISTMGVDLETFRPLPEAGARLRAELGISNSAPCLGFVGRLAREKQVAKLLAAFQLLPDDAALIIVGDGPLRGELEAQCRKWAKPRAVHFTGAISAPTTLNRYYNAFDLLVLPSAQEGFGVAILEALAAGTQVLASDLPGPRALLGEGRYGALSTARTPTDLAREMLTALADPISPARLAERAREYSWKAVCERHAAILDARHASLEP